MGSAHPQLNSEFTRRPSRLAAGRYEHIWVCQQAGELAASNKM